MVSKLLPPTTPTTTTTTLTVLGPDGFAAGKKRTKYSLATKEGHLKENRETNCVFPPYFQKPSD